MTEIREPMRLPPLGALRVFEAAARYESFSRAATELFVTHGAVSHPMRALEEDLGVPLFERRLRCARRPTEQLVEVTIGHRQTATVVEVPHVQPQAAVGFQVDQLGTNTVCVDR